MGIDDMKIDGFHFQVVNLDRPLPRITHAEPEIAWAMTLAAAEKATRFRRMEFLCDIGKVPLAVRAARAVGTERIFGAHGSELERVRAEFLAHYAMFCADKERGTI